MVPSNDWFPDIFPGNCCCETVHEAIARNPVSLPHFAIARECVVTRGMKSRNANNMDSHKSVRRLWKDCTMVERESAKTLSTLVNVGNVNCSKKILQVSWKTTWSNGCEQALVKIGKLCIPMHSSKLRFPAQYISHVTGKSPHQNAFSWPHDHMVFQFTRWSLATVVGHSYLRHFWIFMAWVICRHWLSNGWTFEHAGKYKIRGWWCSKTYLAHNLSTRHCSLTHDVCMTVCDWARFLEEFLPSGNHCIVQWNWGRTSKELLVCSYLEGILVPGFLKNTKKAQFLMMKNIDNIC